MARNVVGSAYVELIPTTDKMKSAFSKAFSDLRPTVAKAGQDLGKQFSKSFEQEIDRSMTRTNSRMQRAGREQAAAWQQGFSSGMRDLTPVIDSALRRTETAVGRRASTAGDIYERNFSKRVGNIAQSIDEPLAKMEQAAERAGSVTGDSAANKFSDFLGNKFAQNAASASEALTKLIATGNFLGTALTGLVNGLAGAAGGLFALAAASSQAVGALAALPGIISTVVQLGATLGVAFSGVGSAISEGFKQATTSATNTGTQSAAVARQVEAAQQRIADARQRLTEAEVDGNKRIEEARQRLADVSVQNDERVTDARRRLIEVQTAASERVADASRQVADAERDLATASDATTAAKQRARQAEINLTQARADAIEELQQLNFTVEEAQLSEERASLALEDAAERLREARSLPADDRTRREAELAYREAELSLEQARDRAQDLQKEQEKARQAGIKGTQAYRDAQQEAADAQKDLADAARREADQRNNLQQEQVEKRREERDAVNDIADAEEDLRRARYDSAIALRDATQALEDAKSDSARNVQDARRALQQARADLAGIGAAGASSAAGVDQFAAAMAKLSPSAQDFVRSVIDLKPKLSEFKKAVQQPFFTQINKEFTNFAETLLPVFQKGMTETGKIAGKAGAQLMQTFAEPGQARRFASILEGNNDILRVFTSRAGDGKSAMDNLAIVFTKLLKAIQPVTRAVARWFSELTDGWRAALNTKKEVNGLSESFLKAWQRAKLVGRVFKGVWDVLKELGSAADSAGKGLLKSMVDALDNTKTSLQENRKEVKQWFNTAADSLRGIARLVGILASAFGSTKQIESFNQALALFTGQAGATQEQTDANVASSDRFQAAIGRIADAFADAGPSLAELVVNLTDLLANLTDSNGIQVFFNTLSKIVGFLNTIAGNPFVQTILGGVAAIMGISRAFSIAMIPLKFFVTAVVGGMLRVVSAIGRAVTAVPLLGRALGRLKTTKVGSLVSGATGKVANSTVGKQVAASKTLQKDAKTLGGISKGEAAIVRAIQSCCATLKTALGTAGKATGKAANVKTVPSTSRQVVTPTTGRSPIRTPLVVPSTPIRSRTVGGGVPSPTALKASATAMGGFATKTRIASVATRGLGTASRVASVGLRGVGAAVKGIIGSTGIGLLIAFAPEIIAFFTNLYKTNEGFRNFIDTIVQKVQEFVGVLIQVFTPAIQTITGLISALVPVFQQTWEWIKTAWETVGVPIFEGIKIYFRILFELIKFYIKPFVFAFNAAWTLIKLAWETVGRPIFEWVRDSIRTIVGNWKNVFNTVVIAFRIIWQGVQNIWNERGKPIFDAVKNNIRNAIRIATAIFNTIKIKFSEAWDKVKGYWDNSVYPFLQTIKKNLPKPLKAAWDFIDKFVFGRFEKGSAGILGGLYFLKLGFDTAVNAIGKAWEALKEKMKEPIRIAFKWINDTVVEGLNTIIRPLPGDFEIPRIPGYARGGTVRGKGSGTSDSILARLSNDEFVVRAKYSRKYRKLLEMMNAGQLDNGVGGGLGGSWWDSVRGSIANTLDSGRQIVTGALAGTLTNVVLPVIDDIPGLADLGVFSRVIKDGLRNFADAVRDWGEQKEEAQQKKFITWVNPAPAGIAWGTSDSADFGPRVPPIPGATSYHEGWDIGGGGWGVRAASGGVAQYIPNNSGAGNTIVIVHPDGLTTRYLHLSRPLIRNGARVRTGQRIGIAGGTGNVSGPHLHFEVIKNGTPIDPRTFLQRNGVKGFAKGGYVAPTPGGMLSVIGEAGRTERVEPLDSRGLSKRDQDIVRRLDALLAQGAGKGQEVRVFIGDQELKGIVRTEVHSSSRTLARRVSQGRKLGGY